jgi:hypothetical protein
MKRIALAIASLAIIGGSAMAQESPAGPMTLDKPTMTQPPIDQRPGMGPATTGAARRETPARPNPGVTPNPDAPLPTTRTHEAPAGASGQ